MQYALRERATSLGWHEQDTHVIDADLGRSGTTTDQREGFQHLVAQIALGAVGILLAFDATRLARNCAHWYQLLDLCGLHDCLIADRDGVYDPTSINGRLLLGLKGQISELELHTIRARLTAACGVSPSRRASGRMKLVNRTKCRPWGTCSRLSANSGAPVPHLRAWMPPLCVEENMPSPPAPVFPCDVFPSTIGSESKK